MRCSKCSKLTAEAYGNGYNVYCPACVPHRLLVALGRQGKPKPCRRRRGELAGVELKQTKPAFLC